MLNSGSGFEKIGLSVQGTALGANSVELREGSDVALDSVNFPAATARTTGLWSRDAMFPSGGSFVLNAAANHPSGAFTARTNASFSLAARHFGVGDSYDEEGQTTQRTIAGGAIASGRTQYLTWDGAGRLVRVVQDAAQPPKANLAAAGSSGAPSMTGSTAASRRFTRRRSTAPSPPRSRCASAVGMTRASSSWR